MSPIWDGTQQPDLPPRPFWMAVAYSILGAIRLILVFVWLLACGFVYAVCKVAEPILRGATPRHDVLSLWARGCLRLLGLKVYQHGDPSPNGGALVANHTSWLDIVVLATLGHVVFVAKSDVRSWPIVGLFAVMLGCLFIERRPTQAKLQTNQISDRIAQGERLLFFPEGTTTDGLRVVPFKSSLFAGLATDKGFVPIQPISIRYEPSNNLPRQFYGWWGDMSLGSHVWSIATRSYQGGVHIWASDVVFADQSHNRKTVALICENAVRDGWENSIPPEVI